MKKICWNILWATSIIIFLFGLIISCSNANLSKSPRIIYSQKGWTILIDYRNEQLTVKQKDLGVVLSNVELYLRNNNNKPVLLSGWTVKKKDNQKLIIETSKPKVTTWVFIITDEGIKISSSDSSNSLIKGIAPASGERIPARIRSQNNGVIYTSLGFVSAKNIHCLFDRETDILILFPKESNLSRNASNEQLMDVTFTLLPSRGPYWEKGRTRRGLEIIPSAEISLIPNYYTAKLGLKHYKSYWPQHSRTHPFKTAPTGWLSWYCYYMPANEEDMVKETNALANELKQYGLEYVQLDATFTKGAANWLEWDREKFPKGGKWLMHYIKSKGLKPGLWVNVFGANYQHPSFGNDFPSGKYPENWFLHDRNGHLISACCTADNTVNQLDYSNLQVIKKHLIPLFRTLVNDWGIEYLKDAGHGKWQWSYEANRTRVYNPSLEGKDLYWKVQNAVRVAMGPRNWIMGCDAEGGANYYSLGFGPFDSSFDLIDDVYDVWQENIWAKAMGTKMHLASMFSANYLNDIVLYNDPDATMIRPPLTMAEAINNVTSISLTGQSYMISDFMSQPSKERVKVLREHTLWGKEFPQLIKKLSDKRLELYKKTMPSMNITPIDLYPYRSEAEYAPLPEGFPKNEDMPKGLDLKVNVKSGVYDVVAVYNWSGKVSPKVIFFGKDLGLDSEKSYLVFDFWNQKLKGIFKNQVGSLIPPHGVRVFVIRPLTDSPQLLATSRHITSAFSIQALAWKPSEFILSGVSKTVPKDMYSLFIYVPKGMTVFKVDAKAKRLSYKVNSSRVLKVNFLGQKVSVGWSIKFKEEKK